MKFIELSTYFSDKNSTEAVVYKAPGQALFRVVAICSNRTRVIQDFNSLDLAEEYAEDFVTKERLVC
jgi:hypothetical protein